MALGIIPVTRILNLFVLKFEHQFHSAFRFLIENFSFFVYIMDFSFLTLTIDPEVMKYAAKSEAYYCITCRNVRTTIKHVSQYCEY